MDGLLHRRLPLAIAPLSIVSAPLQRNSAVYLTAAKVAERFQIPYIHSLRSSLSMEALDRSIGPHLERWVELFPFADDTILRLLVGRAEQCSFRAILLTIDEFTSSPPSIIDDTISSDRYIRSPDMEAVASGGLLRSGPSQFTLEKPDRLERVLKVLRALTDLPIVLNVMVGQHTVVHEALGVDAVCLTIDQYTLFNDFIGAIEMLRRNSCYDRHLYVGGSFFTEAEVAQLIAHGVQRVLIDQPIVWGLMIDGFDGISNVIDIYMKNMAIIR